MPWDGNWIGHQGRGHLLGQAIRLGFEGIPGLAQAQGACGQAAALLGHVSQLVGHQPQAFG